MKRNLITSPKYNLLHVVLLNFTKISKKNPGRFICIINSLQQYQFFVCAVS